MVIGFVFSPACSSFGGKSYPSSHALTHSTEGISETTDVRDRCPTIHSIVRLNELTQEEQLQTSLIIL